MRSLLLICLFLAYATTTDAGEILSFRLFDGEMVDGKLSLPNETAEIGELVIYVHGTGPATYDNPRGSGSSKFNYFDYFADEFNRRGIAFFTYNKRGVTFGPEPPFYDQVDREKFRKAVPSAESHDLATYIKTLRRDRRLKKAKIVLLGWSEGTILAAMAGENRSNKITALFLNGYVHDTMTDVIKWQNTGFSAMVNLRAIFDADKNGSISRVEYESDEKTVADFRIRRLQNAQFPQFDQNKDELIDAADFALLQAPKYKQTLDAIQKEDEDWIWKNYFRVSIPWLKEHDSLEPNKERLLRLKIPIFIFHGEADANCRVEGVYDLRKRFDAARKTNLHESVFSGHNHDLNFGDWVTKKQMPEGIRKMFETAELLKKN